MEIYYSDRKLYINIFEELNNNLIDRIRNKMYYIIDVYEINDVIISCVGDIRYNLDYFNDLISDYKSRYKGNIRVK